MGTRWWKSQSYIWHFFSVYPPLYLSISFQPNKYRQKSMNNRHGHLDRHDISRNMQYLVDIIIREQISRKTNNILGTKTDLVFSARTTERRYRKTSVMTWYLTRDGKKETYLSFLADPHLKFHISHILGHTLMKSGVCSLSSQSREFECDWLTARLTIVRSLKKPLSVHTICRSTSLLALKLRNVRSWV